MALANVTLSDTFDTWRTRTNQLIVTLDQIATNAIYFVSNTSTINVAGRATLGNTIYFDSNAFARTGGSITGAVNLQNSLVVTGDVNVFSNLTVTSAVMNTLNALSFRATTVTGNNITITANTINFSGNLAVSGNLTANNINANNYITTQNITVLKDAVIVGNVTITGILNLL